jgi:hypothetical protein
MCQQRKEGTYHDHAHLEWQPQSEIFEEFLVTDFLAATHDRGIRCGLARARYIMDVQTKRVAHTMWEKGRAYTRREYYILLRIGPEDTEFLEAVHEGAVTKELYGVPVQTGLKRF